MNDTEWRWWCNLNSFSTDDDDAILVLNNDSLLMSIIHIPPTTFLGIRLAFG